MNNERALIYDWSIRKGKKKLVVAIMVLACLGLIVVPIVMSPMTEPLVLKIGLGAYCLIWLALIFAIVVTHEALHGLFFYLFSRKVSFGVKWKTKFGPAPYASSPGTLFSKRQYQMIGFAPQFLSALLLIVGVFLHAPALAILVMAATANLAGGCVDMWSIYELQRMPKDILVEDTSDGFKVWQS